MHRTAVSAVFLVMSFGGSGLMAQETSFASEAPAVRIEQTLELRDDSCMGTLALKDIEGLGERLLCTTATAHAGAHFTRGSAQPFAFRKMYDPKLYELTNLCLNGGCVYAPDTDTLWEKRPGPYVTSVLYRYKDFSRHARPLFDISRGYWTYEYTGPPAERMLQGIVTYGVSHNGQWVAAEVRDRGLALIGAETGHVRRITPILHHYGRGYDPQFQIAVQNDGRRLLLGGMNVTPALVRVDDRCGDTVVGGLLNNDGFSAPGLVSCDLEALSFAPTLTVYRYSHHPKFDEQSDTMLTMVRSMSGADFLVEKRFSTTHERKFAYMALGDSFTSGEGEDDDGRYLPGTNTPQNRCHVSGRSYPFLLIHTPLPMHSAACSGAMSQDLLSGTPQKPAQLSLVREHQPTMVTTSIGGNDLDLVGKLAACAGPDTCVWARPTHRNLTAREARLLYDRLVDVFTEVRTAAPFARHFAVGYPIAIDPTGMCDALTSVLLNADERRYLYESQRLLNTVISSAAQRTSLTYVDVSRAYHAHELCSGSATPAMNGLRLGDDAAPIPGLPRLRLIGSESFHPTPLGHALVAPMIDAAIKGDPPQECTGLSCDEPFPEDDSYWGALSEDVLVYRLNHHRDEGDTYRVDAGGYFAAGSHVTASLFSQEVELSTERVSDQGELSVNVPVGLLGDETHTLLLKGVNERGQEVTGYTIIRAESVEQSDTSQSVGATTDQSQRSILGTSAPIPAEQPTSPDELSQVGSATEPSSGVVLGKSAMEEVEDVTASWLAPIFATIGLSLGIIALWLYFVRS